MPNEPSELDRLNVAARAEVSRSYLPRMQAIMTFLAAILVLLAVGSEASRAETVGVWVAAGLSIVTCATLWMGWRYAFHLCNFFFFLCFLIGLPFALRDDPSSLEFASAGIVGLLIFLKIRGVWTVGKWFAAGNSRECELEKRQIREWLIEMAQGRESLMAVEMEGGAFSSGYFTYVLLNAGRYWVVAKFHNRSKRRVEDLRVLDRCEPQIAKQPSGKVDITIGEYKITQVRFPWNLRDKFQRLFTPVQA